LNFEVPDKALLDVALFQLVKGKFPQGNITTSGLRCGRIWLLLTKISSLSGFIKS